MLDEKEYDLANEGKKFTLHPDVKIIHTLCGHKDAICRVAWSPDGRMLATPSKDNMILIWDIETGEILHSLMGTNKGIYCVAWSPDGQLLASGDNNSTVLIWDTNEWKVVKNLRVPKLSIVLDIQWSPEGNMLACGTGANDNSINIWKTKSWELYRTFTGHNDGAFGVRWLHGGDRIASCAGSPDNSIRFWDVESNKLIKKLPGHKSFVTCLALSPDGSLLASSSADKTIRIWDISSMREIRILEGHTGLVSSIDFSSDGLFLASKSKDSTYKLWRTDTWEICLELTEKSICEWEPKIAFHPTLPILAVPGNYDRVVRILEFDFSSLLCRIVEPSSHYINAKVVLVGDTGVGKTGLSLVLTNRSFEPTDSTHGRLVSIFNSQELKIGSNIIQTRETLLWDLAGQPGYRVIHQLHLNEVAVALVVFDARSEVDPLAGVRHWERALRLAQQRQGASSVPTKKFLVSARNDRGGVSISEDRLRAVLNEYNFDRYFKTSSKEGWQIKELHSAIEKAIDWESLPKVSSSRSFTEIKSFLLEVKKMGYLLSQTGELYNMMIQSQLDTSIENLAHTRFVKKNPHKKSYKFEKNRIIIRDYFETCISLLENRDLVRRLSFGDYVLLQPEILDAYASAIVLTAKEEPDGLGSISEEIVLAGKFFVPEEQRIKDLGLQQLLLYATVEELIRYDLAMREYANDGIYLVFPSQFNRDYEEAPEPKGKALSITFDGPVQNLYATLVVRLSHSGLFTINREDMWRNASIFSAKAGGKCGLYLQEFAEAHGRMILFFNEHASIETRYHFEEFIRSHAERHAVDGKIDTLRFFICSKGHTLPNDYAKLLLAQGKTEFVCPCGEVVSLIDPKEKIHFQSEVDTMDKTADLHRDLDAFVVAANGETKTRNFLKWAGDEMITLAIVFTNIIGSYELKEYNDDGKMIDVRVTHFQQTRILLEKFKGRKIKSFGDSLMAAFKSVDTALDYARELQKNTGHPKIRIRASIHIGPMYVAGGDVFGGTVNFAARMLSVIKGSEIWLSSRAKEDIDQGASKHKKLNWKRHDAMEMKGFHGLFTLWSIDQHYSYAPIAKNFNDLLEDEKLDKTIVEASTGLPALAIKRIVLKNIRGFESLDIQISSHGTPDRFVLILGDNAAGKTTLLRAIASTFCDEANSIALVNPASLLRSGAERGYIRVEFGSQPNAARIDDQTLWIENHLHKVHSDEVKLIQKMSQGLSRKRLFIAGYGPSRLSFGREQEVEYSSRAAVMTLFERDASLMHPELVLRRIASRTPWEDISKQIDEMLLLPQGSLRLDDGGGLSIMAPHGFSEQLPFTDVGDGYLSTLNWILDLYGSWFTFIKDMPITENMSIGSISGVVLVDEIEQHLHPSWQREVVRLLHKLFPNLQFITTTHSALCALGTTAIPNECQVVLLQSKDGILEASISTPLGAQNVNQILTSPLFGLFSVSGFGIVSDVKRYSNLKSMQNRTLDQENELTMLRKQLEKVLGPFEDEFHCNLERVIRQVVEKELAKQIEEHGFDSEVLNYEIRLRLLKLLDLEVQK